MFDAVLYCTPQIYARGRANTQHINPIGTAVLIRDQANFFLVTAKHVYEELQVREFLIAIQNTFIPLYGEWRFATPATEYDNIDMAILRIHEGIIPLLLVSYKFLPVSETVDISPEMDGNILVVAGFPAKTTVKKGENIL